MESKARVRCVPAQGAASEATPLLQSWDRPLLQGVDTAEALLGRVSALSGYQLIDMYGTGYFGLTQAEATARLDSCGLNLAAAAHALSRWQLLGMALVNPFNVLLAVLALVSVAAPPNDATTGAILTAMVAISASLRFWQEAKNQQAAIDLRQDTATHVKVLRTVGGENMELSVPTAHLVPGDVCMLAAGDVVPADCIVLEASGFTVSQSGLTGESDPQPKTPATKESRPLQQHQSVFDRPNVLVTSTGVISGEAKACVVNTGDATYLAHMTRSLNSNSTSANAFQRGIRNISYLLICIVVVMVVLVFVINGLTKGDWLEALIFSVSVGVGVVPEMLPAIVNANLTRGAHVLSLRRTIVKRVDAIQNLGAMDVLCSDKTGTLTMDEVGLEAALDFHGRPSDCVLRLAFLNAANQSGALNSLDRAIINKGTAMKLAHSTATGSIPFTFETRRSAAVVQDDKTGALQLIVKGALEEVLALCGFFKDEPVVQKLCEWTQQTLRERSASLNDSGLRVLGVATVAVDDTFEPCQRSIQQLSQYFVFQGLLVFLDPPKADSMEAIANLRDLSIQTKVLTGDSLGIALRVCQQVNLDGRHGAETRAITGNELDKLTADEFLDACEQCSVFAKMSPVQKSQVIQALQARGHTVGMLGDGINDSIALRSADVGISVDTATDVAKDCAAVLLTDKELDVIVQGVCIGRQVHGNTLKYIKMAVSSNFGNVISIVLASAWLPFEPMTALQILAQNLLYDISQVSVPWDSMDADYLQTPKRWDTWDLIRFSLVLGPTSSTIDIATFCLGWFYYGVQSADDVAGVALFRTHWFLEGLLTQTLVVHLLRTDKVPFLQSRASIPVLVLTAVISAIGVALPFAPGMSSALDLVLPARSFLLFLVAELALYFAEVQLVKVIYIKCFGSWL